MPIIDMYATPPKDLKDGDVGLLIVKVMLSGAYGLNGKWATHFKLYRCPCPQTPGFEMQPRACEPQGDKIYGTATELIDMCFKLYPAVVQVGILPDPDTVI